MPSPISAFITELRRRRVFRVAAVYGGVAFVITEIVGNTFSYLGIPDWFGTAIIVLIIIGFPIAIGLAWAFDITDEGIVRAKGRAANAKRKAVPIIGNPALGFITSLAILIAAWSWWQVRQDPLSAFEHSVVVMPFENLTNDPDFDVWGRGLANLIISDLSRSKELYVLDSQSLFDVIQAIQQNRQAQVIPDLAREVANRTRVEQVILGDILKTGTRIRVQARLLLVKTGKVNFSYKVDVENEDDLIGAAEEISRSIQNHLELNIFKDQASAEAREGGETESAEAFKYYMEALDHYWRSEFIQAIPLLEKAASIDTNFSYALGYLAFAYGNTGQLRQMKAVAARGRRRRSQLSPNLLIKDDWLNAVVTKNPHDEIRFLHLIVKAEPLSRLFLFNLGAAYNRLNQPVQAARYFDKTYTLCLQWDSYWQWTPLYRRYGDLLHAAGSHRKELAVYEYGLKASPEAPRILNSLGRHYLSIGDTQRSAEVLDRYRQALMVRGSSEAQILRQLGTMYSAADLLDPAMELYLQAIESDPEYPRAYGSYARILIANDLDLEKGLKYAEEAISRSSDNVSFLDTYGWGLYKLGRYDEALVALEKSWEQRFAYNWDAYDHLQAARKAVAEGKQ